MPFTVSVPAGNGGHEEGEHCDQDEREPHEARFAIDLVPPAWGDDGQPDGRLGQRTAPGTGFQ